MSFRTFESASLGNGIHHATVKSAALRRRADISFYVPPEAREEKLPLVILLHGVYGSHWAWLYQGGAHEVLERVMKEEDVPPMMLAMPSDGLWGDGSGYLRHREADYARWIVDEVPEAAAKLDARCQDGPRFISGLSMGGYGALRLGLLHPQKFAGISAHSSITEMSQMQGFVEEALTEFELTDTDPLAVIDCAKLSSPLPQLRFDCGTEDSLIEPNRALHRELEAAGIRHGYEEFPGGHTWEYWHEHLADTLRFFHRCLRQVG